LSVRDRQNNTGCGYSEPVRVQTTHGGFVLAAFLLMLGAES
jgi:hypothetical protein